MYNIIKSFSILPTILCILGVRSCFVQSATQSLLERPCRCFPLYYCPWESSMHFRQPRGLDASRRNFVVVQDNVWTVADIAMEITTAMMELTNRSVVPVSNHNYQLINLLRSFPKKNFVGRNKLNILSD